MSLCKYCGASIKDTDKICIYCGQENPNFKGKIYVDSLTDWNSGEVRKISACTEIPGYYTYNMSKENAEALVRQELADKLVEEIAKHINIYVEPNIGFSGIIYKTSVNIECL